MVEAELEIVEAELEIVELGVKRGVQLEDEAGDGWIIVNAVDTAEADESSERPGDGPVSSSGHERFTYCSTSSL